MKDFEGIKSINISRDEFLEIKEKLAAAEKNVVSVFSEGEFPIFRQGTPKAELEEVLTAEQCTFYVAEIESLRAKTRKLENREADLEESLTDDESTRYLKEINLLRIREDKLKKREKGYRDFIIFLQMTGWDEEI